MRVLLALIISTGISTPALAAPSNIPAPPRPSYEAPPRPSDWELYASAFELQAEAKWKATDTILRDIQDPILLGHILYQRYMHPTGYRASWKELSSWLAKYADHPGAWRVYKLAKKRRPRGASMPKQPPARVYHSTGISERSTLFTRAPARQISREVRRLVYRERPTQALRYISAPSRDRHLTASETDYLKSMIARSYYIEGKPDEALKLARQATRSRADVELADWHAGLAAWRLADYKSAAEHFEILSNNDGIGQETRAAALFWHARALTQLQQAEKAHLAYEHAARQGLTFYALLAQEIVYGETSVAWHQVERIDFSNITHYPAVTRAAALDQANQRELAELELLYLQERLPEQEAKSVLDLAKKLNYPAVELAISTRFKILHRPAEVFPPVAIEGNYPILDGADIGGFLLDRALILALIRQESGFKARAKSHAGARGLMQVMPHTAAFVTGDRSLARQSGRDQLLDSETNLSIGQKYLSMLLGTDYFDNNLIYALAGYNAGPGNLKRWRRELGGVDDPLLFIESISSPETRKYVMKVMENMWVYRKRLAQKPEGLRQLADNSWPSYAPQDLPVKQAQNEE